MSNLQNKIQSSVSNSYHIENYKEYINAKDALNMYVLNVGIKNKKY